MNLDLLFSCWFWSGFTGCVIFRVLSVNDPTTFFKIGLDIYAALTIVVLMILSRPSPLFWVLVLVDRFLFYVNLGFTGAKFSGSGFVPVRNSSRNFEI